MYNLACPAGACFLWVGWGNRKVGERMTIAGVNFDIDEVGYGRSPDGVSSHPRDIMDRAGYEAAYSSDDPPGN